MLMTSDSASLAERTASWRRQIGQRHGLAEARGPRPFAVFSYQLRGTVVDVRRLPPRQLTVLALFDERLDDDRLVTRFVGAAVDVDEFGLRIGGVERTRFDKDLRLAPCFGRGGMRLDAADGPLFDLALGLERYLERCSRHPYMPRRPMPRWPSWSAGSAAGGPPTIDLTTLPKRQVVTLASPARDLVGQAGFVAFDFVNTRFRSSQA